MREKKSPQSVIDSYRKRQQMMPYITWGLAGLLVLMGIILIFLWVSGGNSPQIALFSSPTPTATSTLTPSPVPPTATVTMTPTETETPTPTLTFTPSGPFEYTVQSGDTCFDLAVKYEVDLLVLLALNNFPAGQCPIREGDKILIPAPNQQLPTETPLPTGLPRGTRIEYVVKTGDTLDYIASIFNSTVDDLSLIH
ncbi:MAG: LysM peptidoglycan-binding domain-containing protein, partial [Bellilinea sp.]|nr:LysM peptidoglycan-binding domain-containing protein [Bellilinea sp.]